MKKALSIFAAASCAAGAAWADVTPTDNVTLALNMYSNQRARQIGDLLTVTVNESTSSSKTEALKTSKTAKADGSIPYFGDQLSNASGLLQKFHNNLTTDYLGKDLPIAEYKIDASSAFDGSGSSSSAEKLNVTFTVRVVDILQNGTLVVRGDRRILMKNESVNIVFTGLVRPKDISATNSIDSTRVADAHIYYENEGEVSRGTKPGYVWRIFQYLNPF
ncbi:MAG: hypothetical protein A2X49_09615 [Lentisphaerae bacterium GWF2_52_8]|nr:MAG: hypothetical protein A2X49_09615 [Lentisphaerae bacterium GWF2_52_8]